MIYRSKIITRLKIRQILQFDPSLNSLFTLSASDISMKYKIPIKKAIQIARIKYDETLLQQIKTDDEKMFVITIFDKIFPPHLKLIPDPPLVLYAVGHIEYLNYFPNISVIGTRQPSVFGERKIKKIVEPLVKDKWCIISGLAKGIDGLAHQLALDHDCPTIAVLGGGFSHIYPKVHYQMFKNIMRHGLVISEYVHDERPQRYYFPERNRLISGLSSATLVIEAMEKSGTFITVDQALEQGRDVYAVPGSPLNPQAKGCNLLIQEGAKLVQSAENIIEDYPLFLT